MWPAEELQRYNRQIILPEIGRQGQERLRNARVLLIGAGGLGSPAALYLAAAGIGTLGLVDDDAVDLSNLQRQVLFASTDAGHSKAECGAERLRALNPHIEVRPHHCRLSADNAEALFADYDIIVDGSDNFTTKFLANDCAVKQGKPLVYGSILGFDGQMAVFWARKGACYRCMLPRPPEGYVPNCAEAGVIGAVAGVIGCMQALEVVKLIVCDGPDHPLQPMFGKLTLVNTRNWQQFQIDIPRNPHCPCCSLPPGDIRLVEEQLAACATTAPVPGVDAEKLKSMGPVQLLDVRTAEEFARGHLPGSVHIPLDQLDSHPDLARIDPERECVVVCQSGARSRRAIALLKERGYQRLWNLEGGLALWPGELES